MNYEALHTAICLLPDALTDHKDSLHRVLREHEDWTRRAKGIQIGFPDLTSLVNSVGESFRFVRDLARAGEEK